MHKFKQFYRTRGVNIFDPFRHFLRPQDATNLVNNDAQMCQGQIEDYAFSVPCLMQVNSWGMGVKNGKISLNELT